MNTSLKDKSFLALNYYCVSGFVLGLSRIGDNKKVSQIEMLADEQLLVLISGKGRILVCHSVEH